MKLPQTTDELTLDDQRALWQTKNRGVFQEVADQFEVSRTFVYKVFKGEMKSGDLRVERELSRRGCPGF